MTRRGFALLIVLWSVVGAAAVALASNGVARASLDGARNRANLTRARWRAADCLERARQTIEGMLGGDGAGTDNGAFSWRELDRLLAATARQRTDDCDVSAAAAGAKLNVNAADAEQLGRLLAEMGVAPPRADSLIDALLDWRDADDVARERGAERDWYGAQHRTLPRNAPIVHMGELQRIRGWDSLRGLDSLVDVEAGRVPLGSAPLLVLGALPGMTAEALSLIATLRARGERLPDLVALAGRLSPAARQAMLERFADLARLTTSEPDAWIVRARGWAGEPAATVTIEVRLVRAGTRAAIVRRRTWAE